MKKLWPFLYLAILTFIFLWEIFLKGWVPVPGDIIVGHYYPWKDHIWEGRAAGFPVKNFELYDVVTQLYPWQHYATSLLKQGQLPLWNPYNLTGTPLLANLPAAVFYPIKILFLVFPFLTAWTIYIGIQTLLASSFMYWCLRNLKLSSWAAVFGGIIFGWSSFMMTRYEYGVTGHTWLWLPLVFLAIDKLTDNSPKASRTLPWRVVGMLALVMMILGGYLQAIIYGYLIALAYTIFKIKTLNHNLPSRSRLTSWLIFFGLPLLLTAIQWIPFLEIIIKSSRIAGYGQPEASINSYLMPWNRLVTFIAPDFFGHPSTGNFWAGGTYKEFALYIGFLPFILALYTIFNSYSRSREIKFWTWILLLGGLFLTDSPLAKLPYWLNLPGYSALLPSRLTAVVTLALGVLAAYGWDQIQNQPMAEKSKISLWRQNSKLWKIIFLFGLIMASLWGVVLLASWLFTNENLVKNLGTVSKRNLILPTAYLIIIVIILWLRQLRWLKSKPLLITILSSLLLLITSVDLLRQGRKYNSQVPPSLVFPDTQIINLLQNLSPPPRLMVTHSELLPTNSNLVYQVAMIDGYDSVHDQYTETLLSALNHQSLNSQILNSGRNTFTSSLESPALNLVSPEYLLTLDHELSGPRFKLTLQEGRTRLYQNLHAYPRVYLTKDLKIVTDPSQVLSTVLNFAQQQQRKAVLEKPTTLSPEPLTSQSTAELTRYSPNEVEIKTVSNTDAILVFNDAYNDGWRVFIDSQEVELLRTNYAFRGVKINSGTHQLKFIYDPQSFKLGKWITMTSLFFFVASLVYMNSDRWLKFI